MELEGDKIVTAREMARVEKISIDAGASDEAYMLRAGEGIAEHVEMFIQKRRLNKEITLLVGKGNNGGDAFVAGTVLLQKGFHVFACPIADLDEATPLCQKHEQAFIRAGGEVCRGLEKDFKGVILDGLLGTGFKGKLKGKYLEWIEKANLSKCPILSIDIPSGVNGNSGEVDPIAIQAEETLFLGLPKRGFFYGEGYNFIGRSSGVDFGMEKHYLKEAKASAFLLNERILPSLLPLVKRIRHKYQAGYVVALAGSPGMPGAALLTCLAAMRSGAGIVRLFHPEGMEGELTLAPYELIRMSYPWGDPTHFFNESKRASAALIGPGLGRMEQMHTFVQQVASQLNIPCVIDADGLIHLKVFPKGAVLTPHHQEMLHLLGRETLTQERCQEFVELNGVTVVLKGAPTWIYHPQTSPIVVPRGDPGMATAGTGDVLTGIIAALLAQKVQGREAAVLGVYLHAIAGEIAAAAKTSYGMIASDLIEALPLAFQKLLTQSA